MKAIRTGVMNHARTNDPLPFLPCFTPKDVDPAKAYHHSPPLGRVKNRRMLSDCHPGTRKGRQYISKEEFMVQEPMARRRPLGITIIAIIVAIYGILSIIGGIALLSASATAAIIAIVLGVLQLILAWGLWTLQRWAFWATVVIEVLAVINGILALTGHSTAGPAPGIIGIIIALIVLIYLFADRNVRAAFGT